MAIEVRGNEIDNRVTVEITATQFHQPRPAFLMDQYRVQGNNTPMKLYSYLGSGRPVLATRLPTHTQVLDDSVAMLVEPNASALSEGMLTLASDAGLRDLLANNARKLLDAQFNAEMLDARLADFYLELPITSRTAADAGEAR